MNITMPTIVRVIKHKSGPFECAVNMFKWPRRSIYIGNIVFYLIYLLATFPRSLEVDLEGSSTFPTLTLSMHTDR